MNLWQAFVATARALPGFVIGAPTRWVARTHQPDNLGDGTWTCRWHRGGPVEWPCRAFMDAADALAEHPSWRLTDRRRQDGRA